VTRRLVIAAGALAATFALSGCGTFDRNDAVAQVNGVELDQRSFAELANDPTLQSLLQSTVSDDIDGSNARSLLTGWVVITIVDKAGLVPQDQRTSIDSALATTYGQSFTDASPVVKELLVTNALILQAQQQGAIDTEQVGVALAGADIFIDPRYGRWDGATGAVVALGG